MKDNTETTTTANNTTTPATTNPRLPYGWKSGNISEFPLFVDGECHICALFDYDENRCRKGCIQVCAD